MIRNITKSWYFCQQCGVAFLSPRWMGERKYCSFQCHGKARITELNKDPEFQKKRSESASINLTKLHKDPTFRQRNSDRARERIKEINRRPEIRDLRRKMLELQKQDPIFRELQSKASKAAGRKTMMRLHLDPQYLQRKSERARRQMIGYNKRPNGNRSLQQIRLSDALDFPPEWREFHIDLGPVRDQVPGCQSRTRADLAHPPTKTVIEVDGWYHNSPEKRAIDSARDKALNLLGWHVIRVSNEEIKKDLDFVTCKVLAVIYARF